MYEPNKESTEDHNQENFESAEHMIRETAYAIRRSIGTLRNWGKEALDTVREKPESVLVAAGISGAVAGSLLRRTISMRRSNTKSESIDPSLILAGGLLLGALLGPKIVESALAVLDSKDEECRRAASTNEEPWPLRPTGSMDERPFEKI